MAQYQDLKRKGGADPDHQMSRNHAPPPLSIEVPKMRDLPNKSNPWSDDQLPVDILLLTTEACEFLACFAFLKNSFKTYYRNLGYVYFGTMGESEEETLKVALMRCSSGPGGALIVIKNAAMLLRPKVTFFVGECMGLNPKHTKLGDVVVSSTLSTEQFATPVRRNLGNLNLFSIEGWKPPLKDPVGEETVQVHCDSDIFCGSQFINKQSSMSQSRVTAVEREGEGLFAAAHDMNIELVIVKGISHFSDDSNTPDESWKSFASIMAASLVSTMLHDPVVFKEWPHYEDLAAMEPSSRSLPDSVSLEECQKQLRSLYETSSTVRLVPFDRDSAVHIDEIYTDLSWFMDQRTPTGVTQQQLDHYTEIFVRREPNPAPKRILVYGQPGIGKTFFTRKATFDWSQHRCSETLGTFDLVLLVRLRDVSYLQDVPSILRASRLLWSDGAISVDNLYNYVRRHQEKVLLILDGFDEYVYLSRNESPVLQIWEKNQLRDCCVVITSWELRAETLISFSDALFKIDGFNDEHQQEIARRFLKDDEDVEEFLKYLEKHDLRKLAQIPLLLPMLCLLWTKTTREELPKERADIFARFIETLFDHMSEKQNAESVSAKDYSVELYALGRLAFEALLQGQLYFPVSQLPTYSLIERLIEVGLFRVFNMASLNPEKGVHFINKSLQAYLAACFLKEELLSGKVESNSLVRVESIEMISKVGEVLEFACELSEEAARKILSHLEVVAEKETSVAVSHFIEKLKRKRIKDDEDITKDKLDNNEDLIPAFVLARGDKALAAYRRAIETGGSTYDKRVKVLLVGQDRVGKTSLGKALRGEPFDEAELSTDGVQMIPAVKNAGTGAWRNPASLEHTTVFDHKVAAETAKSFFSTHSEQPATKQPTETSNKSEPEKPSKKPNGGPSNQSVQLSIEDEDPIPSRTNQENPPVDQEEEASRQTHHFPRGEEVMPDHVTFLLAETLARNELDPDEKIWPVIWDFAGQDIYRAIHPIFMSPEDLYLLVFDLTKKLSEKAVCRVNVGHREHAVTARDDEDTNLDHLLRWMDLIHSLKKGNQEEKEKVSYPPVILVGTHADCVDDPSEAMKLVKRTCLRVFCKHSYLPHIRDRLSIDNKNAGFNQKDIEKFREAILKVADEMPHTKKPIPLQWHRVEKEISQPKWQRRKFLFKESFREDIVSRYCDFENEDDDFEELLHFLHSRGTIVYHEHEYDGLVILDPQWLIKKFCKIINVNPQEKEPMDVEADRTELEEKGILSEKLIDHTCRNESLSPIKDHLISLMDKFNLICRQKTGESQFLVPCMLRTTTDEEGENETGSSVPIYLRFQTEYVPNGLFSRLIVLFVKNPQYTNMYELTSNKAKFTLNKNSSHAFQMVRYKSVIKLGFGKGNPSKEDYEDVLRRLDMFLEKLQRECHWLESMSVELCARCTVCIGRKTKPCARHEESWCRHHDCGHYIPLVGKVALCCKPGQMLEKKLLKPWIKAIEDVSKRSSPSSVLFKTHESVETPKQKGKRKKQKSSESDEDHSGDKQKRKTKELTKAETPKEKGNRKKQKSPESHEEESPKEKRKRKKQRSPELEEEESPKEKRKRKKQRSPGLKEEPPPDEQERKKEEKHLNKEIKEDEVLDDDLERLSKKLGGKWKALTKRLGFDQDDVDVFDINENKVEDKSYRMLCTWKRREASSATFKVLYEALCHVGRNDLAEKYCIRKPTEKEASKSEG